MDTVTISSGTVTVGISPLGAEIMSVVAGGRERIWQGDEASWQGHAPVLFPFCGRLINKSFKANGKRYDNVDIHGFAKTSLFTVAAKTDDTAVLTLTSNNETRKLYPFDFDLTITYKIVGDKLRIDQTVTNTGTAMLPYNIGRHEGYALEGNLEDYSISFYEIPNDPVIATKLDGGFATHEYFTIAGKDITDRKWYDESCTVDGVGKAPGTIMVERALNNRVSLNRKCADGSEKPVAKIYFPGYENILFWTVPGAGFIAIEPWSGIPDVSGRENEDIFAKEGINVLKPGVCRVFRSEIEFA